MGKHLAEMGKTHEKDWVEMGKMGILNLVGST